MPADSLADRLRREAVRHHFLPHPVRLLFIGESPPASGRFFYDSNSGLYRAMLEAFETCDFDVKNATFRAFFCSFGCFLSDLCVDPVDHLGPKQRRAARAAAEPSLARTIAQLNPPTIVTLLRSIEDNVARAAAQAGWQGPIVHAPYPGRWARHRKLFVDQLVPELRKLRGGLSHNPN
jgi:hypothetical protein